MPAYVDLLFAFDSYKANPASVVATVVDEETGEEKKRLINRTRWKGFGPIAINFSEKDVPHKPSDIIEKQRPLADKKLLQRLEEEGTQATDTGAVNRLLELFADATLLTAKEVKEWEGSGGY